MTNNNETQTITYREQGTFETNGGDVGGDNQVTDAANRRFVAHLPSGEYAVVDVYAYGISDQDSGDDTATDVEVMTFYTTCTDPEDVSGTETYSDVHYYYPVAVAPESNEQAYTWAANYVRGLNASDYEWDGSPIRH